MKTPDGAARQGSVARALYAGAIGGAIVGVIDTLSAWRGLGQFVGFGGRIRLALYAASLYGMTGALLGALVAATIRSFLAYTALGPLYRHAVTQHETVRAKDPRDAMVGVSLVIAGLPAIGAALAVAYKVGLHTIIHRKHQGLIIAVTIAATLISLAVALGVTLALGRGVDWVLRKIVRGRTLTILSAPLAPFAVLAGMLVGGGAMGYVIARKPLSLDQVHLRPMVVAVTLAAGAGVAWPIASRVQRAVCGLPRRAARLAIHIGTPIALFLLAISLGGADSVRKGGDAYLGLVAPISAGVRWVVDFDRDGYSPILGGGDCNDWNPHVHPGAYDIPDNGIDENCLGGDLKLDRSPEDVHFVPVPASVPADATILLITIDTLRADHLGAYGYSRPTTPAIDALAAESTVFDNSFSHAPSTRYSMPAIITGRYPSQVAWGPDQPPPLWWPAIAPANTTIAEILKARGFFTGAILNLDYFEPNRGFTQGFDTYDDSNERLHHSLNDPAKSRGSSSREQADSTIAWLDQHGSQRFFLWTHYYDPHFEYEKHDGFDFGDADVDRYDSEIRYTDEHLGRVFTELKRLGLWDKTIIVIVSDHGEGFHEHGEKEPHGYDLYAAQTKVPLIIRVPGLAPHRATMPVGHVDLLPTLANLAGAEPNDEMLGRSLVDVLSGEHVDDDRPVFQEVIFEGPSSPRNGTRKYGVVTKAWHVLYEEMPDQSWQCYDRAADTTEREPKDHCTKASDAERAPLLQWIDRLQFPPGAGKILKAALLSSAPSPQITIGKRFGNAELVGADLPASARRGETIEVTYYWKAHGSIDGDWIAFVHFGPMILDHTPVIGMLPFSAWQKGQWIADHQTIAIPTNLPPGDYALVTGLWSPQKRQNHPMQGGGDHVQVGTIHIAP
jgi:arylsulfatase A-like enzyme